MKPIFVLPASSPFLVVELVKEYFGQRCQIVVSESLPPLPPAAELIEPEPRNRHERRAAMKKARKTLL